MRKAAAKALWLAKGAALFWGLALTPAVVLGVATTALAAVPGDPFRLGKSNLINNAITTLVGTKSGGPMVVDNNSSAAGSRALDLRVAPGRSPMVVSPRGHTWRGAPPKYIHVISAGFEPMIESVRHGHRL